MSHIESLDLKQQVIYMKKKKLFEDNQSLYDGLYFQENSMSLEGNNDHKTPLPMHNPLDNDGFLADFLSPHTVNHPTNNSIPRESDIIKEELMNSSRCVLTSQFPPITINV